MQDHNSDTGGVRQQPTGPAIDAASVRQQLERILAHPLFRNSKRYPRMLRYVVEQNLEGAGHLKERTLGNEVFGRDADYDTNLDPVVRTSAAEIRKRIAQYYHEPGHELELRIELPPGSYAPEFHVPQQVRPGTSIVATMTPPPLPPTPSRSSYLPYVLALVPTLVLALLWWKPWVEPTPLDRFWKPVLGSSRPVLLCVGQRSRLNVPPNTPPEVDPQSVPALAPEPPAATASLYQLYMMGRQNVAFPDVSTISRLAGLLQAKGQEYAVRGELSTTFEDLRRGSIVLIGAFNNDWTIRLMGSQRYSFQRDGSHFWIQDHDQPGNRQWSIDYAKQYMKLTEDYALISRSLDPTTGRMVVVAAGLSGYGTIAAGEFLTNPEFFDNISRVAPSDWPRKNIQVVLSTKVFSGNSGRPQILAVQTW